MKATPYEYYTGKLGVKISYLINDRDPHADSLCLIAYNALYRRMKSKTCIEQQLRRASLNIDALVLHSSLSQDWKDAITLTFGSHKEEIKKSWFSEHYEADRKAFDFFAAHRYGDDNRKLDLALIERYTYNASVLNAVIKIKANRKAYAKALGMTQLDIWDSLSKDVNAFRDVDHNLPSTSRGLRMKVNDYVKDGYAAIISGRLQNQNASKMKDAHQMALIDELLNKHTNLDNAQVANLYNTVAGAMDWKLITAQTVGNRKEEKGIEIYAGRNGKNALLDNKLMQIKRKAPSLPMLMWTLDGWDAELLYQKTEVGKGGNTVTTFHNRLTMVTVLDPFNKYPVGYAIGTHETPQLIKDALRNAMTHVDELFGAHYRPYQLQSDNYGRGALQPTYEACSTHYTPARVKNAKAKIIEPWFNRFNKEYCQMFNNWSGHNVDSGSKSQPNDEMLNKIRRQFPNEKECRQQLVSSIEADRLKKQAVFIENWAKVTDEYKSIMPYETYLQYLGRTTGYTNRLQPDGFNPTINGVARSYDSFDLNFRKLAHLDWIAKYDPADLSKILVINADKRGKEVKEVGTYQFILNETYVQPMALADRNAGDAMRMQEVKDYNSAAMKYITDVRSDSADLVQELFSSKPQLNDTLAKLILVDSAGQHKDRLNASRVPAKAKQLVEAAIIEDSATQHKSWQQQQQEYYRSKVNTTDYL